MFGILKKLPTIGPKKAVDLSSSKIVVRDLPDIITEVPAVSAQHAHIQLGDLVRDSITGFEGIANARMEFLNKCIRFQVQPQSLHEGQPIEAHVFDEEQLIIVKAAAAPTAKSKQTGGDHTMPGRSKTLPSRY